MVSMIIAADYNRPWNLGDGGTPTGLEGQGHRDSRLLAPFYDGYHNI